jgi:uncharacterized paraquat-inducible protein A
MIELSMTTAAMLYLSITMAILLGLWLFQHYKSRQKKIVIIEEELLVCEYCHFAYMEDRSKGVTQCPQCQSYNKCNVYKAKKK